MLSCDAKGVVMRPEGLREQTRTQAQSASGKLKTRLSKGEKQGRKRMAEIVTVYELTPEPRPPPPTSCPTPTPLLLLRGPVKRRRRTNG